MSDTAGTRLPRPGEYADPQPAAVDVAGDEAPSVAVRFARLRSNEGESRSSDFDERIDRLDQAINTLVWFLVAAQTGFGETDAHAIEKILNGGSGTEESSV